MEEKTDPVKATKTEVDGEPFLGALLRIPFETINLQINQTLIEAGYDDIRPSHQTVFQHLPAGGARITDLADRSQITKQSMSSLVSYLEERGYLQRVDDPTDGRAHIIQRTMRGWEVEQTARKSIRQLEADWALLLGEEPFQQLRELLRKLINATKP